MSIYFYFTVDNNADKIRNMFNEIAAARIRLGKLHIVFDIKVMKYVALVKYEDCISMRN